MNTGFAPEQTLSSTGSDPSAPDLSIGGGATAVVDFIHRPDFRLFKLHGSVRWSRMAQSNAKEHEGTVDAAQEHAAAGGAFDGDIRPFPPPNQVQQGGGLFVPAIAVLIATKTAFECPQRHLDVLADDSPHVRRVLYIGWRAADPHAVELLEGSRSSAGLSPSFDYGVVCGSGDRRQVVANPGRVAELGHLRLANEDGFTSFIDRLDTQLSLVLNHPESVHR